VSDSRTPATDDTGRVLRRVLERNGHAVVDSSLVPDEVRRIRAAVRRAKAPPFLAEVLLINGGTGIAKRDVTVEAVAPLLEKQLPGFGELFRRLSYEEIGSPAWLSRALAGTHKGMFIACLPGSPQAARLALNRLLIPELGHAVGLLRR
jgi:molybdenum cofactor biosynthesis protein B